MFFKNKKHYKSPIKAFEVNFEVNEWAAYRIIGKTRKVFPKQFIFFFSINEKPVQTKHTPKTGKKMNSLLSQ